MTFILDSLQMVVLGLGAAAVLAFLVFSLRSDRSPAFADSSRTVNRPVSPTTLADRLVAEASCKRLLLCRIQTPSAGDAVKIKRLLDREFHEHGVHLQVENGVVVSSLASEDRLVDQLGHTLQELLKRHGFTEGSCLFWTPVASAEALLTWILRGDQRAPTGPLRIRMDVRNESVDESEKSQ
jgi:hypothetical protein